MHCVSTSALRWQYLLLLFWSLSLFLRFPIHHSELEYFRIFQISPVSAWWCLHGGKACQRLLMSLYLHSPPPPQVFDLLMLAHRWHLSTYQNVLVESPYQFIWYPVVSAPGKQTLKSCFSLNASVFPQILGCWLTCDLSSLMSSRNIIDLQFV